MVDDGARLAGLASVARGMRTASDELTRLQLVTEAAVDLVDRCKYAGITLNDAGECLTLATSAEVVRTVNAMQNELGEGPCHDPHRTEEVVVSNDVSRDERWPSWGARIAAEHGLASAMSVLVFSDRTSYGTLSLYAAEPGAFTGDDLATAQVLAAHLAVSLAASREIDGLGVALHSRTVIGQAVGIVMERLDLSADRAMAYLKRVSSHHNTKLVAVAMELVESRTLPTSPE